MSKKIVTLEKSSYEKSPNKSHLQQWQSIKPINWIIIQNYHDYYILTTKIKINFECALIKQY